MSALSSEWQHNGVRALDEQWAASLGSTPASVAAVFGGAVADLHNGALTACQPRIPPSVLRG